MDNINFDPLAWAAVGNMNLGHAVKKEDEGVSK